MTPPAPSPSVLVRRCRVEATLDLIAALGPVEAAELPRAQDALGVLWQALVAKQEGRGSPDRGSRPMSAPEALSLQDLIRLALTRIEPVLTDWPQLAPAIPELASVLDDLAGEAEAGLSFTRLALAAPPERLALLEPVLTGHAQFCEPALGLEWADFEKRGLRAVSGRYQALQAHAWFLAVRSVLEAILRQIGALAELAKVL